MRYSSLRTAALRLQSVNHKYRLPCNPFFFMMEICGKIRKFLVSSVGLAPFNSGRHFKKVVMPGKKTFFQRFVEIAACISLLLGIMTFFREDASARTRTQVDIDNLKQAAPGIEKRLDEIEKVQASIITTQQRIDIILNKLESRIDSSVRK